uniref:Uncharacterized protein n=1 Tax=Knipowitschia caucasica TaxID=637954 RepID=A0AAV2LUN3_KNICA
MVTFTFCCWSQGLEPGAWSLEPGAWSLELELGAWSLEPGAWSLEPGAWSLEPGAWSLELEPGAGAWSLEPGAGAWSWSLELEPGAGAWSGASVLLWHQQNDEKQIAKCGYVSTLSPRALTWRCICVGGAVPASLAFSERPCEGSTDRPGAD